MKVAIHKRDRSFSLRWYEYCQREGIAVSYVNCYDDDIVEQLQQFDVLLWHYHHTHPKDVLFAKQLLFSLEQSGLVRVFPDFRTGWHFDDKVAQKYLLEALGLPMVRSYVFYDKKEALSWVASTDFPKVFKLRGGAGSANVRLVRNREHAVQLVRKAFGKGFPQYDAMGSLSERIRKWRKGLVPFRSVMAGLYRFVVPTNHAKTAGNEKGYIYFQDFIPDNDSDLRVIVIGHRAFAIKRMTREGDFRASGSGHILYEKEHFSDDLIRLSFEAANKLGSRCAAFDFVMDGGKPLIVEVSYGFSQDGYEACVGYWTEDLTWHEGAFNPQAWIMEDLLAGK